MLVGDEQGDKILSDSKVNNIVVLEVRNKKWLIDVPIFKLILDLSLGMQILGRSLAPNKELMPRVEADE